eukprot:766996-Hanusia_phi.AAC.1
MVINRWVSKKCTFQGVLWKGNCVGRGRYNEAPHAQYRRRYPRREPGNGPAWARRNVSEDNPQRPAGGRPGP